MLLTELKVRNDHRSKFSNLSNWKEEAWKNQGFNGILWPPQYRCDALPCKWAMKPHVGSEVKSELWSHTLGARSKVSYEATHWELGWFVELKPWFFQASSFQLLKLENLRRWSFLTLIYHRSSHMNYFIYTPRNRTYFDFLLSLDLCGDLDLKNDKKQ